MESGNLIRLEDGWVSVAIDNLDSLGDVGDLDFKFLEKVLPQCSKDQLMHIERSTTDTDLTPITDRLWKKIFEKEFGVKATDAAIQKMKIKKETFKWSELYQEKLKSMEEAEKEIGKKVKRLYQEVAATKQTRQVRVLVEVPPSCSSLSNKRISCSTKGSRLMNKARKEYRNCLEVRNIETMKMKRSVNCSGIINKPRTVTRAVKL